METQTGSYVSTGVAKMLMENSSSPGSSCYKRSPPHERQRPLGDSFLRKGFPSNSGVFPSIAYSETNHRISYREDSSTPGQVKENFTRLRHPLPNSVWPSDLNSLEDLHLLWKPFSPLPVLLSECISEMKWQDKYFLLTQIFSDQVNQKATGKNGMDFKSFQSILHRYPCIERGYIRELFSFMDCQRNGVIQETDFISGLLVSSPEAPHLELSVKHSYKGFKTMVERITGLRPSALIRLQLIFLTFDCDGDAILNTEELSRLLCRILSILCNEKRSGRLCLEDYSRETWESRLGCVFFSAVSKPYTEEKSSKAYSGSVTQPNKFTPTIHPKQSKAVNTYSNAPVMQESQNFGELVATSLKKLFGRTELSLGTQMFTNNQQNDKPTSQSFSSSQHPKSFSVVESQKQNLNDLRRINSTTSRDNVIRAKNMVDMYPKIASTGAGYYQKKPYRLETPRWYFDRKIPFDEQMPNEDRSKIIRQSPQLGSVLIGEWKGRAASETNTRPFSFDTEPLESFTKPKEMLTQEKCSGGRYLLNPALVSSTKSRDIVEKSKEENMFQITKDKDFRNFSASHLVHNSKKTSEKVNNNSEKDFSSIPKGFLFEKGYSQGICAHNESINAPDHEINSDNQVNKDIRCFSRIDVRQKKSVDVRKPCYDDALGKGIMFPVLKQFKIDEPICQASFNSSFPKFNSNPDNKKMTKLMSPSGSESPKLLHIETETLQKWKQEDLRYIASRLIESYDMFGDKRGLCFSMFIQAVLQNDIPGTSVLFRTRQDICSVVRNEREEKSCTDQKKLSTPLTSRQLACQALHCSSSSSGSKKKHLGEVNCSSLQGNLEKNCHGTQAGGRNCKTEIRRRCKDKTIGVKNENRDDSLKRKFPSFPTLDSPQLLSSPNTETLSGGEGSLKRKGKQNPSLIPIPSSFETPRRSSSSPLPVSLPQTPSTPSLTTQLMIPCDFSSKTSKCSMVKSQKNRPLNSPHSFSSADQAGEKSEGSSANRSVLAIHEDAYENNTVSSNDENVPEERPVVEDSCCQTPKNVKTVTPCRSYSLHHEKIISTPTDHELSDSDYNVMDSYGDNNRYDEEENISDTFSPLQLLQELVKTHEQHLRLARRALAAVVTIKFEGWDGPSFLEGRKHESGIQYHKSPLVIPGVEKSPLYILQERRNDSAVKLLPLDLLYQLCDAVVHILRDEPKHVKVTPPVSTISNLLVKNPQTKFYCIHPLVERFTQGFEGDFNWKMKKKDKTKRLILFGSLTAATGPQEMLELIVYVFSLKLLYPTTLTLLRGPFDDYLVSVAFGFAKECIDRYGIVEGKELHRRLFDVLEFLPICCSIESATERILCVTGDLPEKCYLEYFDGLTSFDKNKHIPSLVIHTLQAYSAESSGGTPIGDETRQDFLTLCFELIWSQEFMKAFNVRTKNGLVRFNQCQLLKSQDTEKDSEEDHEWPSLFSKKRFLESNRFKIAERRQCFQALKCTYLLRILPEQSHRLCYNLLLENLMGNESGQFAKEAYFSCDSVAKNGSTIVVNLQPPQE